MEVIRAQPTKILAKDWRYSVAKEFQSRDGASATWAPDQPQEWGTEQSSAPLKFARHAALNADSSLLAVSQYNEVLIHDTSRLELIHVLRGRQDVEEEVVLQVGFHPQEPLQLVSCMGDMVSITSKISFWNLALDASSRETKVFSGELAHKSFYDRRGDRILFYTSTDRHTEPSHEIFVLDLRNANNPRRVGAHIGSGIRWLGFGEPKMPENDERFCESIGSASFDGTFKIWDAGTLQLRWVFRTGLQNIEGAFSPNGQYFVGCANSGSAQVWDLHTGSKVKTLTLEGRACDTFAFSPLPNSTHFVLGGSGTVALVDVTDWSVTRSRSLVNDGSKARNTGVFAEVINVKFMEVPTHGDAAVGMFGWQLSADGGLELYEPSSNRKWRFAAADGQARGWAVDWFWLYGGKMLLTVDQDAIRKWAFRDAPQD